MTESTNTPTTPTDEGRAARQEVVRKAYTAAEASLRTKYKDEFNDLVKAECAKHGVEWAPRKTAEEKAREEFERLLAENPQFAEIAKSAS